MCEHENESVAKANGISLSNCDTTTPTDICQRQIVTRREQRNFNGLNGGQPQQQKNKSSEKKQV